MIVVRYRVSLTSTYIEVGTLILLLAIGPRPLPFVAAQPGLGFISSVYFISAAPVIACALHLRDFAYPVSVTRVGPGVYSERLIAAAICSFVVGAEMVVAAVVEGFSARLLMEFSATFLGILLILCALTNTVWAAMAVGLSMITMFGVAIIPGVAEWVFVRGASAVLTISASTLALGLTLITTMGFEVARRRSSGSLIGVTEA